MKISGPSISRPEILTTTGGLLNEKETEENDFTVNPYVHTLSGNDRMQLFPCFQSKP